MFEPKSWWIFIPLSTNGIFPSSGGIPTHPSPGSLTPLNVVAQHSSPTIFPDCMSQAVGHYVDMYSILSRLCWFFSDVMIAFHPVFLTRSDWSWQHLKRHIDIILRILMDLHKRMPQSEQVLQISQPREFTLNSGHSIQPCWKLPFPFALCF
jgi:hypothetical protein